ncbi:AfsR/SARP family transcriptional regulator [Streptomyces sp. NBC_00059]|uniref:AfsR/SARP family transcriptional regulator n=1 Tax=Streptomyces sp. NBC_00059 TaxID=2975635 RepID=UPI002258A99F|nr:AfsR/SARP family transcriptional regulator [Streptomyces sp. NBC_00059]MCX5417783.1 AfsR/SARP family transcriptional regulator [Streptomyces sp. NBC_00059]
MQFNLIGPFAIITDDGRELAPGAPKIRQMLTLLALQPRETVSIDALVQELWADDPPPSALKTVHIQVSRARRLFTEEAVTAPDRALLVTRAPGYLLRVDDDDIDVKCFEGFVRRAQREFAEGTPGRAADFLTRALSLWRGPVLSGVPAGPVLAGWSARVEELRVRALELHVEVENHFGRHRELLPELRTLVNDYPLHEWFHGQLISALHRSGRRAEALEAYGDLHRLLRSELGLIPSPDVRRLQTEILNATGNELTLAPRPRAARERAGLPAAEAAVVIAG